MQMIRILHCLAIFATLATLSFALLHPASSASLMSQQQGLQFPSIHDHNGMNQLLKQLIEIPSVTGDELAVGEFLQSKLSALGLTVELQAVSAKKYPNPRYNLLAYPGKHRQTRVLLTSHIDTVPPFIGYSETQSTNGTKDIRGRGSNDDKGAVAAQIYALTELLAGGLIRPSDASLLFVVGEETGGDGMKAVNDLGLHWEAVIFGEPTELKLVTGHKGLLSFNVYAKGKACHSGYPWEGRSATSMLIPALVAIEKMPIPGSAKLGDSTINIGRIDAGVAQNVVPENAMAGVSVRLADGSVADAKKIILDTIKGVDERLEVEWQLEGYPPQHMDAVPGFETDTVNYGTDVPNLEGNHKRFLYGAGSIKTAHSVNEFVNAEDMVVAARGYKHLILEALKLSPQKMEL